MKWFQVDSDTPNDPKIRALIAQLGNEGFGALVRLWCFTARYGARPGWTVDRRGRPIATSFLAEACGLPYDALTILIDSCVKLGHIAAHEWRTRQIVVFPAMCRRVDTYTMRRVRTLFEHSSKKVPLQDKTRQDIKKEQRRAAPPSVPRESYRVILRLAHDITAGAPDADFGSLKDLLKTRCAQLSIPYDALVVNKALESAIATPRQRRRRG